MTRTRRRSRLLAAAVGIPLLVFLALATAVAADRAVPFDARLVGALYELSGRHANLQRAEVASALAGDVRFIALVLGCTLAVLFIANRPRHALWVVCASAVLALEPLVAETFRRPLPFPDPGFSFPSGHALGTMTVAAVLVVLLPPGLPRIAFAVLAATEVAVVGVSVVGDGGHWPTDVLASWSLSLTWVTTSWWLMLGGGTSWIRARTTLGPPGPRRSA